ncbi:MAG: thermonuclease family protein [candidate division WOR-3 bacterium]
MMKTVVIWLCAVAMLVAAESVQVRAVSDGDTFLTADSQAVRLLGIDAPEIYQPGGDIARDMLGRYVVGRTVRLESDREDKDKFGRLLRYVYLGDTFVNAELVRRGYAAFQPFQESLRFADTLAKLEETAARIGRGLWAFNVFTPPTMKLLNQKLGEVRADSGGLLVVPYTKADSFIGRLVTVEGFVVDTYRSDKVLILNFHQDYRNYFKAVVFATDLVKFPPAPEDYYKKRFVRVTGIVKEYKGAPEMIIKDPEQVQIVEE